jgi:hypothetical protein
MSHDYVSLLARQQGINLRSFRHEAEAVLWLKDRRLTKDRRHQPKQVLALERRLRQRRKSQGGLPNPTAA